MKKITVRIDEDLLEELKARARLAKIPMTRLLDQVLRRGLSSTETPRHTRRFRQKTSAMGKPKMNLDKALSIAAALEDEVTIHKMKLGK
jgi:hypothetical protein